MRIALLSNVTVGVLAGMLRRKHEVWIAPGFGGWMETALAVPAELSAFGPEAVFLLLDAPHGAFGAADAGEAVASLERALPRAVVMTVDLGDLAEEVGAFYDERMWRLGAMPWSLRGLRAICSEIDRLLALMRGGCRKALAVDFDGTLWDGVIGEDGVAGIRPRAEFQRGLRALCERGVLLVGLSKNNASDVESVWDDPRMALGRDDFVATCVDWSAKPENLASVARKLNLGLDAFVFADDNPAERAEMAAALPEVAVAAWPVTARRLERLYFPRMRVTAEDLGRTASYRAEAMRRDFAANRSLDDYLAGLGIRTEIHPVVPAEFARVAQLSQKANQFNVCANRRSADEIARLAADPSQLFVTLRASDRFGDQGLVGYVHVAFDGVSPAAARIVDWVMSCRAMNRRLEFELWRWLGGELARRRVARLAAEWRRTSRNAPVGRLFDRLGFALTEESPGARRYECKLADVPGAGEK